MPFLKDANARLGWDLDSNYINLKGDPNDPQEGDSRLKWDVDKNSFVLEVYSCGNCEFIPSGLNLSRGTVRLGEQVGVSDWGTNAAFTIKRDTGVGYVPPATGITKDGITFPCGTGFPEGGTSKIVFFNGTDNIDATFVDGKYRISAVSTAGPEFYWLYTEYLTCGNTSPTSPVTFSVYEDTDGSDPDKLLVSTGLPVALWDGKSAGDEIMFNFSEDQSEEIPIGSRPLVTFYIEYSSDNPFSLYGDGTEVNRAVDAQLFSIEYVEFDDYKEIDSDTTHDRSRKYVVDTTNNEVDITIPFGTVNSLIVFDAKKKFSRNSCFILIKDAGGATIHTAELDKKDRSYRIYFNGTYWAYHEIGRGEVVEISSYHKASEDFLGDDHAEFHLESPETIALNDDGVTYTKIPNMTVINSVGFTSSGGTLTCVDGGKFLFNGASNAHVLKAGTITYTLFLNGSAVADASTPHTFGAASKTETLAITSFVKFDAGDEIEVRAKSDGVATNQSLTVETLDTTFITIN